MLADKLEPRWASLEFGPLFIRLRQASTSYIPNQIAGSHRWTASARMCVQRRPFRIASTALFMVEMALQSLLVAPMTTLDTKVKVVAHWAKEDS
jgi:hypothetical protein